MFTQEIHYLVPGGSPLFTHTRMLVKLPRPELLPGVVADAAIIEAAQKVDHYGTTAYGTARTLAQQADQAQTANLLEQTLQEEKSNRRQADIHGNQFGKPAGCSVE